MIQNSGMQIFLAVYGVSAGLLVSAGVFTVLLAVGLTPRFVGATHTAKKIFLYEGCIMSGAVIGTFFSVIPALGNAGGWLRERLLSEGAGGRAFSAVANVVGDSSFSAMTNAGGSSSLLTVMDIGGKIFLGTAGLFMGMFVGCLALAIAEMLNSIPIFARRASYRHGLGIAVLAVAVGKLLGSLYYFWQGGIFPG